MAKTNFSVVGTQNDRGPEPFGTHTVTSAEATAGTLTLDFSLAFENDTITGVIAQVTRAGNVVTADLDITYTGTSVTFADGTTFDLTADDVITYIVF